MKRKRYTGEQIVYALKQVESEVKVGEICRQLGVSETTFYVWRKKYKGMGVSELRELRQLREENGKLKRLVAACLLKRPDLFGAAVPQVPVTDMLRYHKFTAGRYWTVEYGNAEENPEHFQFLYAYSPLYNVKEGVTYPPTLITTADADDRVVSMHAKKFAATLQAKDAGTNPILIRIETKAVHGGGKPTSKRIEEYADIYAFLFKNLGVETK